MSSLLDEPYELNLATQCADPPPEGVEFDDTFRWCRDGEDCPRHGNYHPIGIEVKCEHACGLSVDHLDSHQCHWCGRRWCGSRHAEMRRMVAGVKSDFRPQLLEVLESALKLSRIESMVAFEIKLESRWRYCLSVNVLGWVYLDSLHAIGPNTHEQLDGWIEVEQFIGMLRDP